VVGITEPSTNLIAPVSQELHCTAFEHSDCTTVQIFDPSRALGISLQCTFANEQCGYPRPVSSVAMRACRDSKNNRAKDRPEFAYAA